MGKARDIEIVLEPTTARDGLIELNYCVDPARARDFYEAMRKVRRTQLRSGACGRPFARDVLAVRKNGAGLVMRAPHSAGY